VAYAFAIYLGVYLIGWALRLPKETVFAAFWALHLLFLFILGRLALRNLPNATRGALVFWGLLALAFLIPGAYLEYPSDPWAHFARMAAWSSESDLASPLEELKFSYFWGWTFLHTVPIRSKFFALDVYSAFWQMALAVQFYRFVRRLGQEVPFARFQVIAFFCLVGTNLFSFRYYALSSTMLAYIAYLEALILLIGALKDTGVSRPRAAMLIACVLCPMMWLNHRQELLLFLIGGSAISAFFLFTRLSVPMRRRVMLAAGSLIALGFIAGPILRQALPGIYERMGVEITWLGSFRLWGRESVYLETYGRHGIVALLLAAVFFRRSPLLGLFCLSPTFVLLFPPTVVLLSRVLPDQYVTYRLLLAAPLSIPWGLAAAWVVSRLATGRVPRPIRLAQAWAVVGVVLILISVVPKYPWRGRLLFQLYPTPQDDGLVDLIETAEWLRDHTHIERNTKIFMDVITDTGVSALLGLPANSTGINSHRITPFSATHWQDKAEAPRRLKSSILEQKISMLLLPDFERLPKATPSPVGEYSGHWWVAITDRRALIRPKLLAAAELLTKENGWKRTDVPPYFRLYAAP
jgi:hypothetical protein